MTRQDIGEYLGLTIETVSRRMQEGALNGLAASRHVLLRRRSALEQLGN